MNIGKVIKSLRLEKNLTQLQLGKEIGVSQKAIDYWERAVNEPKATYIAALAVYFNVTSDYLLGLEK